MKRTKTFEIEYNWFEAGTLVTPTSRRCPLEVERVYKVRRCHEPMYAEDKAVVFVDDRETGMSTDYLREVAIGEITPDRSRLKRPNFWNEDHEET